MNHSKHKCKQVRHNYWKKMLFHLCLYHVDQTTTFITPTTIGPQKRKKIQENIESL